MLKRLFTLLVCVSMLMVIFPSCSTAEPSAELTSESQAIETPAQDTAESIPSPSESAVEAPPENEVESPPEDESAVEPPPEEELSNQMPPMTYPLSETLETITCYTTFPNFMGPSANCGVETNDDLLCIQKAEELLNVHIDWYSVNFMAYLEQFNVYIAGGDWTDMISGISAYSGGIAKAFEDDVVIDMRPYLEECAPHYWWYMQNDPETWKAVITDSGVLGSISSYSVGTVSNAGPTVNTDHLEAWGRDVPTTFDEMREYLLFAKSECGADIGFWFTSQCCEDNFSYAFGIQPFTCTTTVMPMYKVGDEVKCSLVVDEYKQYLVMLNQWYSDGIINQEFATTAWNPNDPNITSALYDGRLALYNANAMNLPTLLENVSLTPIEKLTLEKGGMNHNEGSTMSGSDSIAVTTQAGNPELCIKWIDFWFSDEGGMMHNYGIEGMTYEIVDGKPVFTEAAINNPYGDSVTNYIRTISLLGKFPAASYASATLSTYSDETLGYIDTWSTVKGDSANVYPSGASLSVTETEEVSVIASDITTFATEQVPLFIMGALNFEQDWDSYCDNIEAMNLDRVVQIYQDAYNRYLLK